MDVPSTHEQTSVPEKSASEILQAHVEFDWSADLPSTFGGYSKDQLVALTGYIGSLIGFTPEQARVTTIHFGDNIPVEFSTRTYINTGMCVNEYTDMGEIISCTVIINRSKEVEEYALNRTEAEPVPDHWKNKFDNLDTKEGLQYIGAHLTYQDECVIWVICEELKHARTALQMKTRSRKGEVEDKYLDHVNTSGQKHAEPYSLNIDELAASRNTLQILAKISREKGRTHRESYFKSLYELSLQTGQVVLPIHFRSPLIPTGWADSDPKNTVGQRIRFTKQIVRAAVFRFWHSES